MKKYKAKILLVEDDPNLSLVLVDYLEMLTYETLLCKDGVHGFNTFKSTHFDLNIKHKVGIRTFLPVGLCLFALLAFSSANFAQVSDTIPVDQQTEQLIEDISEANDGADIDYSEITEELSFYLENPLNLNTADPDILKRVFLLNDFQVYKLKAYISTAGELVTLYELNNK